MCILCYKQGMQDKDAIIAELTKKVETLIKRIQQLEEEVARLKKDSNNSSKPPSSDIVKPKTNMQKRTTKKRKRGGQPGHRKHTRKPFAADEIDSVIEYEFRGKDLEDMIPLDDWHVVQQVTLPKKLYLVTEHRARKYLESKTGKIIIASLPNEVQKGGLLGEEYEGIIGCDYWGAYRKFARLSNATVQYCMAHLIREIRFLAEHMNKMLAYWGGQLLDWLKKLFKTLHRSDELTDVGFARRMDQIKKGFLSRMRRPPNHKLAKKLVRGFKGKAAETYFRFLTNPSVEPTNNGSERAIRHTVIDPRITQGTRGDAGMRWCERIWTTIATCKKQDRNIFEFIHKSLLSNWTDKNYPLFL